MAGALGDQVSTHGEAAEVVVSRLEDRIMVVTLDAADRHNVLDPPMMKALAEAFDSVSARRTENPVDADTRVVILRAAGASFCVGVDIGDLGDYFAEGFSRAGDPFAAIVECPFPVVGAINGPAVTGGFEIALRCDVLVASESAVFIDNHAKYGLHPVRSLSWRLAKVVGASNAHLATMASYPISGRTALIWGLVQSLTPDGLDLDREAVSIATRMAANHPLMVQRYKVLSAANLRGERPGEELEADSDATYYGLLDDVDATVDDGAEKFRELVRWAEAR